MMAAKSETSRNLVSLHGGHTVAADGTASATAMVEAAQAANMAAFGVSEHFYRPRDERFRYEHEVAHDDYGRAGWPRLVEEMLALKESNTSPTELYLGAEVEYLPEHGEWTRSELARWPLDYTVLSVHFLEIDGAIVPFDLSGDHWRRAAELCGGEVALYCRYYEHVIDALSWDIGDVLGHLDVIKLFADSPVEDPAIDALVDQVLETCRRKGMVLDLNARGLLKPCREVYPGSRLLRRAAQVGVSIVTGDDSHAPEQVGFNLDQALQVAKAAGFQQICLPARLGATCWGV
jgi:histidinol-phosphatase (PHP family)